MAVSTVANKSLPLIVFTVANHNENSLASLDLLVIDDFGLMELDVRKSRALLNIIESRDTRKSTIISSQFPVEKWYGFFKDSTYADSLMDRILTKAFKLELSGPSLRN